MGPKPIDRRQEQEEAEEEEKKDVVDLVVEEQADKEEGHKASQNQLIDKFISEQPKISPTKKASETVIDIARMSVREDESLMTETLARVYLEQRHYDKAIKAYEILSLKYPEKSSFFANQILAVKKLMNSKNKS